MVNSVINAVTKQLGTTFGSSYRYYTEDIEQGFNKPSFYVMSFTNLQRSKSAILYDRTIPIVVHYFSDSKHDLKKDCYEKAELAVECLEYLPFEGTVLRGEDISWQIIDDEVLQLFVTYKFTTKRVSSVENDMETLSESVTHTN